MSDYEEPLGNVSRDGTPVTLNQFLSENNTVQIYSNIKNNEKQIGIFD